MNVRLRKPLHSMKHLATFEWSVDRKKGNCFLILRYLVAVSCCMLVSRVDAQLEIFNPNWSITLTDHGYSDLLFDQRPGFEGREYLSGEWAAAYNYSVGGIPKTTTWLEPEFVAPDWLTNSDFAVLTPITGTGSFNASGFEIYTSAVSNTELGVRMFYEFIDTGIGIEQGNEHKSALGPGSSETSDRYVLKQTYELMNLTMMPMTDIDAFQFLHGLHSTRAVYDDRPYGGPFGAHHYDITLRGLSSDGTYVHDDFLSMHSAMMPVGWEVGRYGIEGIDSHATGKPSVGVHLSIEAGALSGLDLFDMAVPPRWVSGAMNWKLPDLAPGMHTRYDVLLSISTKTVPEPTAAGLVCLSLGCCIFRRSRP